MMTAGVALLGGSFVLLAAVACMSAGFSLGFALIATATIANWFVRRRTLAIGILMAGGGLRGVPVPLIAATTESRGWRSAAIAVAIGSGQSESSWHRSFDTDRRRWD